MNKMVKNILKRTVSLLLVLALIFASLLNMKDLRFKGIFRTCIFLPCATALVAAGGLAFTVWAHTEIEA